MLLMLSRRSQNPLDGVELKGGLHRSCILASTWPWIRPLGSRVDFEQVGKNVAVIFSCICARPSKRQAQPIWGWFKRERHPNLNFAVRVSSASHRNVHVLFYAQHFVCTSYNTGAMTFYARMGLMAIRSHTPEVVGGLLVG
ncbi:hypothetical protein PSPO01_08948 [Paraphaeosphaeria sporulosa]